MSCSTRTDRTNCVQAFALAATTVGIGGVGMGDSSTFVSSAIPPTGSKLGPAPVMLEAQVGSPLRGSQKTSIVSSSVWAALASASVTSAFAMATSGRTRRRLVRQARKAAAVATTFEMPRVDRATTKAFRKDLMKSKQYFRFNKTQMAGAMEDLKSTSGHDLLVKIRKNGFRLTIGDVTFVLAESYGFCWGVERTLAMAYEARNHFAGKNVWVTNEIIHNAVINRGLEAMGMSFVKKNSEGIKDWSAIHEHDVVILPAFGASVDEMALLKERNVTIVDAACPWVSKVWNSVEKNKDKGHTSIIHGKYAHEETVATKSFADKYLVIKDMTEAGYVANYILNGGDKAEFLETFSLACSDGFDPDTDLSRIGVANQTTMMKGETELIGRLFERTIIKKFGPENVNEHFLAFNTICDATQERQDAMYKMFQIEYEAPKSDLYADLEGEQVGVKLVSDKKKNQLSSKVKEHESHGGRTAAEPVGTDIDFCLVVGGFNSSNTTHLIEIPQGIGIPTYHIDCAVRIGGSSASSGKLANVIQHKPLSTKPEVAMMDEGLDIVESFIPEGPITIAVTSGASTPDSSVGACLERILALRGLSSALAEEVAPSPTEAPPTEGSVESTTPTATTATEVPLFEVAAVLPAALTDTDSTPVGANSGEERKIIVSCSVGTTWYRYQR